MCFSAMYRPRLCWYCKARQRQTRVGWENKLYKCVILKTVGDTSNWKLLWMNNRKLHMRFRLTPRSMILDGLELYKFEFAENFAGVRIFGRQQQLNEWILTRNVSEIMWPNLLNVLYFSTLSFCFLRWFAVDFFARCFHTYAPLSNAYLSVS